MAKIKNQTEKPLDCNYLMYKYSTLDKEDRENKKNLDKISKFINECLEEVKEKQRLMKKEQRLKEKMEGLYLEVYNFTEKEIPKIYKAMYNDEMIAYGTDFGKNYHRLVLKRKELMNNCNSIKINGKTITQNIPEISIIEVGA